MNYERKVEEMNKSEEELVRVKLMSLDSFPLTTVN